MQSCQMLSTPGLSLRTDGSEGFAYRYAVKVLQLRGIRINDSGMGGGLQLRNSKYDWSKLQYSRRTSSELEQLDRVDDNSGFVNLTILDVLVVDPSSACEQQ